MVDKEISMQELEREVANISGTAKTEEIEKSRRHYQILKKEIDDTRLHMPYPNTGLYDRGMDYEEAEKLKFQKDRNKPYWDKIASSTRYYDNEKLYVGHVNLKGEDYYIMESPLLNSRVLRDGEYKVNLIDVDDERYRNVVRAWRYPGDYRSVEYSRNIIMQNKEVEEVYVLLDKADSLYKDISDAYLRKALLRNKDKEGVQSIVRTIQKKQDDIRLLPKDKTFIVQGCAGSGKTMVLLHRLRYLIRNNDIDEENYIFLGPSDDFKSFIGGIAKEFRIYEDNIMTYQDFYQNLIGRKKTVNDIADERVFSNKYLKRVYSREFMEECLQEVLETFSNQAEKLIQECDARLTKLVEGEEQKLKEDSEALRETTLDFLQEMMVKISPYISVKLESYENISDFMKEVKKIKLEKEESSKEALQAIGNVEIKSDDPRLESNFRLQTVKKELNDEKAALERASFFTAGAHKRKLSKLEAKYSEVYQEEVSILIEFEKRQLEQKASDKSLVFEDVSLMMLRDIYEEAERLVNKTEKDLEINNKQLENLLETVQDKNTKFIEDVNAMIDLDLDYSKYSDLLIPCYEELEACVEVGKNLVAVLLESTQSKTVALGYKEAFKFFMPRTKKQFEAYLEQLVFNSCKRKIKKEFNVRISNRYKHYWYLTAFCYYLTREQEYVPRRYIYIDEAQDLSAIELELLYKVNCKDQGDDVITPVMNLFGDVKQMISEHGVSDWQELEFCEDIYSLDENFRNTNQIVDYCNKELNLTMQKVGVDAEPVHVYKSVKECVELYQTDLNSAKFIVKDEYAVIDLKTLLQSMEISNFQIFTVKSVKGLEFKEVYVLDQDMEKNEKYIAYTRALVRLNIIKELPKTCDRSKDLIIQGEEADIDTEI